MRRALAFLGPLVVGVALAGWAASLAVNAASRRWFERDTDLRSQLAVRGARETLSAHWRSGDRLRLERILSTITRDDRIMAAAACGPDLATVATTHDYPPDFSCPAIGRALPSRTEFWSDVRDVPGGRVHLSAQPVEDEEGLLGFVVLVHDMSYADRREALATRATLFTLGVLALAAALATALVVRSSWRDWTKEMRRVLRGDAQPRQFQPLLSDIRDLADRLAAEAQWGGQGAVWDPDRLRRTLRRYLHGERVVIVANREPYIHDRTPEGTVRVLHPASGLVTALEPVMRACSGVWVAHGSGSADRETADRHGRIAVPPGVEDYRLRRVWLTPEEERGYYYGFANEGLWPLCHIAHARPTFRREDWEHYRRVNARFAEAAMSEVEGVDPILLAQDYHFAPLPALLRERLPKATILTFWHIPWPNAERFGICPWAAELLEGLLGSSILGFHTQLHCNNFIESVDRFLEARIDREQQGIVYRGHMTLVRPYPISIEWPSRWLTGLPPVSECRRSVIEELGLREDALIGVGVDRLDYTKGIEERLLAVERLLEREPALRGRFTFVQLAAPSRTKIPRYEELNRTVEEAAARVNARFEKAGYRPIVLARKHHEPPTVFRYYRAADVCYVSSLDDGMNLVAKEFVAARDDLRGVLVLSSFTGAARELTEALIVNPYDLEQASAGLAAAVAMSPAEQSARMESMRLLLAEFNVYRWAGRMVVDAARLRQRGRVSGRLLDEFGPTGTGRP